MKPLFATFSMIVIAAGIAMAASAPDEGVIFRNKLSLHDSTLAAKAEIAIRRRLETEGGEEEITARRYFTGDIDGDGEEDLLLATDFTNALGNHWSHDFLLIRSTAPDKPIFKNFGGKGERSYESIYMGHRGISVDFLYYAESDAFCCPSIKKKGFFILKGDELIEVKELPALPEDAPLPLPSDGRYSVKAGDSGAAIARRFGLTLSEILAANPGAQFDRLKVGDIILLKKSN